jgi:hypothetical protein
MEIIVSETYLIVNYPQSAKFFLLDFGTNYMLFFFEYNDPQLLQRTMSMTASRLIAIIITLCALGYAYAQEEYPEPLMPVTDLIASDTPNDDGSSITISWQLSPTDDRVSQYIIYRRTTDSKTFEEVGQVPTSTSKYVDEEKLIRNTGYVYKISAVDEKKNKVDSVESNTVKPVAQWFNTNYKFVGVAVILFCGIIISLIYSARRGRNLFIRRINGIEAVDEAIGRATEMGRPILYITGLGGVGGIATLASLNILSRVARRTAEYDTPLIVPANDSFVMVVEREIVKGAHIDAGKPDAYREDNIFFVSDDQFAYTAAVNGIMIREKPAAIFFMGSFFAESLILAETGNSTGAIQIAGTDSDSQLPFFIAACDYTLIGEELYAASAYLSKEPLLLGSLKGQDLSKLILMVAVFLGVIMESFSLLFTRWSFLHWIAKFFSAQ